MFPIVFLFFVGFLSARGIYAVKSPIGATHPGHLPPPGMICAEKHLKMRMNSLS